MQAYGKIIILYYVLLPQLTCIIIVASRYTSGFLMNYSQLLRAHDAKVTPQRLALVEELDKKGHADIDELYESIKRTFPSISLATLYKNINQMLQSTLIKELTISGLKNKYELNKPEHAHMICKRCGKIEDITVDDTSLRKNVENISRYTVTESSLHFIGICPGCSQ